MRFADGAFGSVLLVLPWYRGPNRLVGYLRDVSNPEGNGRVQKRAVLIQAGRGAVMSVAFMPLLPMLSGFAFARLALFQFLAMVILTDIASACPAPRNIEGVVYLRPQYLHRRATITMMVEILLYGAIFGLGGAWFFF